MKTAIGIFTSNSFNCTWDLSGVNLKDAQHFFSSVILMQCAFCGSKYVIITDDTNIIYKDSFGGATYLNKERWYFCDIVNALPEVEAYINGLMFLTALEARDE